MLNILLVGHASFLARAVSATAQDGITITGCSHHQFHDLDMSRFDIVANFAISGRYRTESYDQAHDVDFAVARLAAAAGRSFVMLSSRKVYGPDAPYPVAENTPPAPTDAYGRNKVRTEAALRNLMGERLTILRLSNIFGLETGRSTFFGIALQSLRDTSHIVLDTSPAVRRDFLPVEDFAKAFHRVLKQRVTGTFNMGAGTATALGDIAGSLIEGFGLGDLVVTSSEERDSFLLDSEALIRQIGPYCTPEDILRRCVEIGKEIA